MDNEEGVEESWLAHDLQGRMALLKPNWADNGGDRRFVVMGFRCWREAGSLSRALKRQREIRIF